MTTPEELGRLIDAHAAALELFASQWPCSPADVVQEAFVEYAAQIEPPSNARAWLFRVVRNRAISEARSRARRRRWETAAGEAYIERRQADPHSASSRETRGKFWNSCPTSFGKWWWPSSGVV